MKKIKVNNKPFRNKETGGGQSIPEEFDESALEEALMLPDSVNEEEMAGRLDLRDRLVFTIDGDHTRDFDDAVSLSYENGIYTLGVHIADVSHYVKEDSALDREALRRGTSVYFPHRVIPMLPEKLSNGICSLNEGVDRLTLSCIMKINRAGEIVEHLIVNSVIRSAHRMTYNELQKILDASTPRIMLKYRDTVPTIFRMRELKEILRQRRMEKGALEFDTVESEFTVDENGKVTGLKRAVRNEATDLIEEFMIAANVTVASEFCEKGLPFVYRVHGKPDPDKIRSLSRIVKTDGVYLKTVKNGKVSPKDLQRMLDAYRGRPELAFISVMTLRAMQHAGYSTESTGHFGLAEEMYCHFTSPIRRYPDLQIHRIIKEHLAGRLKLRRIGHYRRILPGVAEKASLYERRAEEAERFSVKLKKCEYASFRIGEESEGVISGIAPFGIYVMRPDTVEGMIHISRIPGSHYHFDEDRLELRERRTGAVFRLGQEVNVVIDRCDIETGNIDMSLSQKYVNESGLVKKGRKKAEKNAAAGKKGKNGVKRKRSGKAGRK